MNADRSDSSKAKTWARLGGPLVTVATLIAVEILSRTLLTIPNPVAIYLMLVAYATLTGGLRPGLISAAITVGHALYHFSTPGQPLHYTHHDVRRLLVLLVITPTIVLLMDYLKRRADRALGASLEANAALKKEVAERQRAEETAKALVDIGRELAGTIDPAQVTQCIASTVLGLFRVRSSALYQLDQESGGLVCLASAGDSGAGDWVGRAVPPGQGVVGLAVREGRTVWSENVLADPRVALPDWLKGRALAEGYQATVGVPLTARGKVIGALGMADVAGRVFTDDELALLSAFADQAALALQNAWMLSELTTRQARIEALLDVSRRLSQVQPVESLLAGIVEATGHLLDSHSAGIRLVEGDDLVVGALWGDAKVAMTTPRLRIGESLSGTVAATGHPLLVMDPANDPRLVPAHRDAYRQLGARTFLGVPLKVGARVLGVLGAWSKREQGFSGEDLALATAFASQAAIALDNVRLYEEAQQTLAALKATQDQLIRMETLRAVGELASGMAHHLNNLLAVILGRAQLLLMKVQEPDVRRALEIVERTALAGGEVLHRVQRFTRVHPVVEAGAVQVNDLVQEVLELTRPLWRDQAQARGISIETALDFEPVPPVKGDLPSLSEVLMNVLLNAIDALPGGGRIRLRTWALEGAVYCSVSDTGVGMSEAVRRRALEPFFTTKGPRSTGLGLSVSYGIVQRHGGDLMLESAEGRGTTVTIRLPVAPAAPACAPLPPAPPVLERSLRILLIDDELPVLASMADTLTALGHRVVLAGEGHEGLARLEAGEQVDLVLTDLGMPEMSGWQVAKAVKAEWPHLQVGLVTGWGQDPGGTEEERRYADFVIAKPVSIDALRGALSRLHP